MTVSHRSQGKKNDFWSVLSLIPSRGHCGTVSMGYKDTDPVGALTETHNPRATQIDRAKPLTLLLFMIDFNTTLLLMREICLFINYQGQKWYHSIPSTHTSRPGAIWRG